MNFNLDSISQFNLMRNGGQIKPYEVGPNDFDPAKIFIKRKNKLDYLDNQTFTNQFEINFDPSELKELEDFCKSRGIIGVNFGNMHPKQVLNMLRSKTGIPQESKSATKTLLHG